MEQLLVTGTTRLLLLVGDPISSVRSPQLFNRLFSEQRRDAVCAPLHVPAEDLEVVFAGLKGIRNLDGVLVTMPHKQAALNLVDHLDDTARQVGAVSVARREPDPNWFALIEACTPEGLEQPVLRVIATPGVERAHVGRYAVEYTRLKTHWAAG